MMRSAIFASLLGATALGGCVVTPTPLEKAAIAAVALDQQAEIRASQEPVTKSISLHEAMARALKYNLDHRVEMAKVAVEAGVTNLTNFDMLPSAVVRTGWSGRNNYSGSLSRNLVTNSVTRSPTSSSARHSVTGDMTLSWNVLDFGLSYMRAKQQADKQLIAEETRRRVANKLIEDVRTAYWRAVSADRLQKKLKWLSGRVNGALGNSQRQIRDGVTSPVAALTYRRELLNAKRQIQELHRELHVAKVELARLMNLSPNDNYSLVVPKQLPKLPKLTASFDDMVSVALINRPEIREIGYRQRINKKDAQSALLEALPNLRGSLGLNYDNNSLLIDHNWITYSARASWNLLKLISLPQKHKVFKTKEELIRQQGLASAAAVMAQVAISRIRYNHLRTEMVTSEQYYTTQYRLLKQMRAEAASATGGEQAVIREEMNTISAAVKRDILHADLQAAFASLFWTVGIDPYPATLTGDESVSELASGLREYAGGGFNAKIASR